MRGIPRPRPALLLDLWALALSLLLCLPAFTQRGLGLSGDLVFSPRQPLTPDTLGLGARLPRAVPLDAVVALLGQALTGDVLFRLAVIAGPLLAGAGAHRLLRRAGVLPRAAAVGFAVWNPYVVERLALGQWALLLAYGALFHIASAALALRDPDGAPPRRPWRTWAWVGLASLTPTGGLLAAGTALLLGASSRARTLALLAGCLVLQLPWVLPSVLGATAGQGTGDASGVAAFRAGPDAPGGTVVSLLGLGGIWDRDSIPTSRLSPLGVLAAAVVVGVVVSFVLGGRRATPYGARRLVPLAALGLLLAVAPRVPGLEGLVTATVDHVPGGGLVRDSQKWLAPYVLLAVVALGAALDRAVYAMAGTENARVPVVALLGLLVPFVLLPDGGAVTWPAVRPVSYPSDFAAVRDQLERDAAGAGRGQEAMLLLPLRVYRAFDWGNPRTAYDPAFAWFDVPLVASDELVVGRRVVSDDNKQVSLVRRALASPDVPGALGRLGIRWVLVYTDDPATPDLRLTGFEPAFQGHDLLLFRVPGTVAATPGAATWRRVMVVGADGVVLAFWLVALGAALGGCPTDSLRRLRVRRRAN